MSYVRRGRRRYDLFGDVRDPVSPTDPRVHGDGDSDPLWYPEIHELDDWVKRDLPVEHAEKVSNSDPSDRQVVLFEAGQGNWAHGRWLAIDNDHALDVREAI